MPFKDPQKQKEYLKDYYKKNKESMDQQAKENPNKKHNNKRYHDAHRIKNNEKSKKWNDINKEEKKELSRLYYIEKKDLLNEKQNKYNKKRKENDPLFKLVANIRSLIYNSINRQGYKKSSKSQEIIGCSFEEFKLHLESKFESWMTWENYGKYNGELNYGWDIDHIIPTSSTTSEDGIVKLNHYTNLQPLCSKVNRDIKINKVDYV